MNFLDLSEQVQVVAAQTLQTLILEERFNNEKKSAEALAQDVRAGFEALYGESTAGKVIGHLVIKIEPQIVGLEKLEALVTQLQGRPGFVAGAGTVTGLQLS